MKCIQCFNLLNLKMVVFIKVNDFKEIEQEEESYIFLMVQFMKVIGKMIWQMVKEDKFMQMEAYIQEIGRKIKQMEMEF